MHDMDSLWDHDEAELTLNGEHECIPECADCPCDLDDLADDDAIVSTHVAMCSLSESFETHEHPDDVVADVADVQWAR